VSTPTTSTASQVANQKPPTAELFAVLATVVGVALGVAGIIIGINVGTHRTVVNCRNGTYFPQGTTDFRCFSHPHAGDGAGLAIVSGMLAILIVFGGILVALSVRQSHRTANVAE
jgi:hypothetical protein